MTMSVHNPSSFRGDRTQNDTIRTRSNLCPLKVFARVRPFMPRELEVTRKTAPIVKVDDEQPTRITTLFPSSATETKREVFTFERCFDGVVQGVAGAPAAEHPLALGADQSSVYSYVGLPVLQSVLDGYNGCILAYGQTGSGKTYTMMGPPSVLGSGGEASRNNYLAGGRSGEAARSDDEVQEKRAMEGIIPRLVRDLFEALYRKHLDDETHSFKLELEYYEIYKEKVMDLLSTTSEDPLRVRHDVVKGPFVEGLTRKQITSVSELLKWIKRGNMERHIGVTRMNDRSSRSHAVLTLYLTQMQLRSPDGFAVDEKNALPAACVTSKLNLVDLAGSERAAASGAEGLQLQEANKINSSLTVLGRVIDALAEASQGKTGKSTMFCPYRDSTLTWLLMDSIGGNSKTSMIATVSPHLINYEETSQTLRYASRAKQIVSTVCVNEDPQLIRIRQLTAEIKRLQSRIGSGEQNGYRDEEMEVLHGRIQFLEDELARRDALLGELRSELAHARSSNLGPREPCSRIEDVAHRLAMHDVIELSGDPDHRNKLCLTAEPEAIPPVNVRHLEKLLKQKDSVITTLREELSIVKKDEKERCKELLQSRKIKQSQIERAVNEERRKWEEVVVSLKKTMKEKLKIRDTTPRTSSCVSRPTCTETGRKHGSRRAYSASSSGCPSSSHREAFFQRLSSNTVTGDSSFSKLLPPHPKLSSRRPTENNSFHLHRPSTMEPRSPKRAEYVSPAFERYDSMQSARSRRSSRGDESRSSQQKNSKKDKESNRHGDSSARSRNSTKSRTSRAPKPGCASGASPRGEVPRSRRRRTPHSPKGRTPSLAELCEDFELCRTLADAERREHLKIVSKLQQEVDHLSKLLAEEQQCNAEVKARMQFLPTSMLPTNSSGSLSLPSGEEDGLVVIPREQVVQQEGEMNNLRRENRRLEESLAHHQAQLSVLRRVLAARDRIYEEVNKMGVNPACFVGALERIEAASRSEWEEEERLNRTFILQQLQLHTYYVPLLQKLKSEKALMSQANILEAARSRQFSKDLHAAQVEQEELIKANEAALRKIHYLKHQLQKESSKAQEATESLGALRLALQQAREECSSIKRGERNREESDMTALSERVSSLQRALDLKDEEVNTLKRKLKMRSPVDSERVILLEAQLKETQEAHAEKQSHLYAELDQLRRESSNRMAYIAEEQERNEALRRELASLADELDLEKSERDRLRAEFHNFTVTNNHKMHTLKKEMEAIQRHASMKEAELQEALNNARIEKEKYAAIHQDQYTFLRRKAENLQEEIETTRNENRELVATQNQLRQNLEMEVEKMRDEQTALIEANEKVLKKVHYLKRVVQQEEEKRKQAEKLSNTLKIQLERVSKPEKSQEEENEKEFTSIQLLKETIHEMNQSMEEKNFMIAQLEENHRELQEKLKDSRNSNEQALKAARSEWLLERERYEAELHLWKKKSQKSSKEAESAQNEKGPETNGMQQGNILQDSNSLILSLHSAETDAHSRAEAVAEPETLDEASINLHQRNLLLEAQNRALQKSNSSLQSRVTQLQDEISLRECEIQELEELKNMHAHLDRLEEEQQSVASAGSNGPLSSGVRQSLSRFSTMLKNKLLRRSSGGPQHYSDYDGAFLEMNNSFASSVDTFTTTTADVPSLHQMLSAKMDFHRHTGLLRKGGVGEVVAQTPQPTPRGITLDDDGEAEWHLTESIHSGRPSLPACQEEMRFPPTSLPQEVEGSLAFTLNDDIPCPSSSPATAAAAAAAALHGKHTEEQRITRVPSSPLVGLRPRPQNQMEDEAFRKSGTTFALLSKANSRDFNSYPINHLGSK